MATDLLALMDDAGVLSPGGDLLRSTVRISSIDDDLFLHSAYPIIKEDAVFSALTPTVSRVSSSKRCERVRRCTPMRTA